MKPNDNKETAPGNAPESNETPRPIHECEGAYTNGETLAYDYQAQQWVSGDAAVELLRERQKPAAPAAPFTLADSRREVTATLNDFSTSDWLRGALASALKRDCVDALHDAEALAGILSRRTRAMLRDELDTVTDSNARPMPRGGSYTASLQLAQARAGHLG